MGMSASAHLVFGYNLRTHRDEWQFAEVDEYGGPAVGWHDPDDEEDYGFDEDAMAFLLAHQGIADPGPFSREKVFREHLGVEFYHHGHEYGGLILGTKRIECDMGEVEEVSQVDLSIGPTWCGNLRLAIRTLGLTPVQKDPCWLLVPSYG